MSALLRGVANLWTPGQTKPSGVPRIDWSHPLANGLVFYGFDCGDGSIIDLARSRTMFSVPGATKAGVTTTPWGTGILYNNSDGRYFLSDAEIRGLATFTVACAYVQTGTVGSSCVIFGRSANNGGSAPYSNYAFLGDANGGGQNVVQVGYSQGGALQFGPYTLTNVNNLFQTASVSTGQSFYYNGVNTASFTLTGYTTVNTQDQIGFSTYSSAGSVGPFVGMVFYGAIWNRTLSDTENMQLHLDPYCFLLPPEGEMPTAYNQASALYTLMAQAIF